MTSHHSAQVATALIALVLALAASWAAVAYLIGWVLTGAISLERAERHAGPALARYLQTSGHVTWACALWPLFAPYALTRWLRNR